MFCLDTCESIDSERNAIKSVLPESEPKFCRKFKKSAEIKILLNNLFFIITFTNFQDKKKKKIDFRWPAE